MKEYKMAKGFVISLYICATILIIAFTFLFFAPFFDDNTSFESAYWYCPLSIISIILTLTTLLDAIYGKLIINHNSIRIKSTFINRTLKFHEIKGFKTNDKYIYILPKNKNQKRIKQHLYIKKNGELIQWLSMNFLNLDEQKKDNETKTILRNHAFGMNESCLLYTSDAADD